MTRALRSSAQLALETAMFFRERMSLFWTFAFPLLLIYILGFAFYAQSGPRADGPTISFLVSGVIGANLIAMAFFNVGTSLLGYKDVGILKRLLVARGDVGDLLTGLIVQRVLLVLIQSFVMMIGAHAVFGFVLPPQTAAFCVALALSVLTFTLLGLVVATSVRSSSAANVLSNLMYLPLAFLSGAYFPVDRLPFAGLVHVLPSYQSIVLLRASLASPPTALPPVSLGAMLAWCAAFCVALVFLRKNLA